MAAKKVSFGAKPTKTSDPVNLDSWVANRALIQDSPTADDPPPIKMKRLTLDIPEPLHKAIKARSVEEGVTMVEMLRTLLQQHYGNS